MHAALKPIEQKPAKDNDATSLLRFWMSVGDKPGPWVGFDEEPAQDDPNAEFRTHGGVL